MKMQEEDKTRGESEQLDGVDDDDDGPPPGFQCIISRQPPPQSQPAEEINKEEDEGEDEGPPPGFEPVAPNSSSPPPSSSDTEGKNKEDETDDGEDDEGPPPGWEFGALVNALAKPTSDTTTDIKTESNEELDEGPPPGWEIMMPRQLPRQMPPPCTPPLQSSSSLSPNITGIEIAGKQETMRNYDEVPPSVSQSKPTSGHYLLPTPPSSEVPIGNKIYNKKVRIKRPTSGNHLSSPLQQPRPNSRPLSQPVQPSSSGKAQLVCGTCRTLCLYPRGANWVKCPGCQEVNFVLEAHEVGQVKCGSCEVLLMYLHGAPAVQCTSCHFVTEIEAHNARPPLSVQQAQKLGRHANRAR
ncbi:LSD1 zinc finger family protein [Striga asiatica]|uniref:LSD1 zinc finger family protein n=1 Tax=Striga asiatica TaxID=4170 RepID=A0A5A7QWE3_STRAF|nr:LSD1 zinc finger family protein [Striga asiatica]